MEKKKNRITKAVVRIEGEEGTKAKRISIPIPVYKMMVHVWLCDHLMADRWFKDTKFHEKGHPAGFPKGGGRTLYEDGIDPICWADMSKGKGVAISTLAHELLHAIAYEFHYRGIFFDLSNHEPYAYALGYCMEEAMKKINID